MSSSKEEIQRFYDAALVALAAPIVGDKGATPELVAQAAIDYADALLAERARVQMRNGE